MNDVKPLYGAMLQDVLAPYSHWGWIDIDCLFGDMRPLLNALRHYDVVAYPDGVGNDMCLHVESHACAALLDHPSPWAIRRLSQH